MSAVHVPGTLKGPMLQPSLVYCGSLRTHPSSKAYPCNNCDFLVLSRLTWRSCTSLRLRSEVEVSVCSRCVIKVGILTDPLLAGAGAHSTVVRQEFLWTCLENVLVAGKLRA